MSRRIKVGDVIYLRYILNGEPDFENRSHYEGSFYEVIKGRKYNWYHRGDVVLLRGLFDTDTCRIFVLKFIRYKKLRHVNLPQAR